MSEPPPESYSAPSAGPAPEIDSAGCSPRNIEPIWVVPPHPVPAPRNRGPQRIFQLTFGTTLLVGSRLQYNFNHNLHAFAGNETLPLFPVHWLWQEPRRLLLGIPFSLAMMSILLAHEMGHYLFCRRYRVPATLPFFIPAPTLIGTFGAFIRIRGRIRSRAALFDIGIAGPIAGFVVAVPVLFAGLALSRPVAGVSDPDLQFGFPLIFHIAHRLLHRGAPALEHYYLHPVAIAAWAGMLATALNLLPGGQLDGGHLVFTLSPRLHRYVSRAVVAGLVVMAYYFWVGWFVWAILLALSALRQPSVPPYPGVGKGRKILSDGADAALRRFLAMSATSHPRPQ
jgi:hypothetical protein